MRKKLCKSEKNRILRQMQSPTLDYELNAGRALGQSVAGVDEVGRGPLAGPVIACAVILPEDVSVLPSGLTDSKKLSAKKREIFAATLRECCAYGLGMASVEEIDSINILQATFLAMHRALAALPVQPSHVLIDGPHLPKNLPCRGTPVIEGDAKVLSIAAASIIAKVARDHEMQRLDSAFPGYGWSRNAGYGTASHLAALKQLGVTPHHRRSFAPVTRLLTPADQTAA